MQTGVKWRGMKLSVVLVTGILACALSGCAPGRIADLRDCGGFSVGIGLGLDATAKIGCVVRPSLGIGSMTGRVGYEDRELYGVYEEDQFTWPCSSLLAMLMSGLGQSSRSEPPALLLSYVRMREGEGVALWLPVCGLGWDRDRSTPDPFSFHELTDLEVGATAVFVSARVRVNPLEIVDFLLGCVGLDIAGDDPTEAELAAEEAYRRQEEADRRQEEAFAKKCPPPILALIKRLRHYDPYVCDRAAVALGKIGPEVKVAVPALIRALKRGEQVRWSLTAADALGEIGPVTDDVVPALIGALKDDYWAVRRHAVDALGKIGPVTDAVIPALIETLNDGDWNVYPFAADALGDIGAPAVPSLIEVLSSGEPKVRRLAASALASR